MLQQLIESGREAQRTGAWDAALAHYEAALELVPAGSDPGTRADVTREIGRVHQHRGDLDRAAECFAQSGAIAGAAGLRDRAAAVLMGRANIEVLRGDLEAASDRFLEAREIAEGLEDDRLVAMVDHNLGVVANIQGNVAMALLSYRSALERYRRAGDRFHAAAALNNMGMAHVDLAEWGAAETCFEQASEVATQIGDTMLVGRVELNRAELHLKRRRYDAARECVDRSLQVFHRLRLKPNIAEAYKFYGILYRETSRPEQSDTHFALSLGMAEACQNRLLQAETQLEWALLHLEEERKQEGVLYLNRALRLFRELKAGREVLDVERRLGRLKEMYLPAVSGWGASLTEGKDPYQVGHAQRVADYATLLAREVGVEGWDLTYVRIGAFIHDLGNMAVEAEALREGDGPEPHDPERVRVHTILGDSLARKLDFPDEVPPIVRSHHEHWAGTGYPDRLAGEEIPFGARIVSIADVFDALTSPRSYRPAFGRAEAIGLMEPDAERVFDPRLFVVFRDIVRRGGLDS